MASLYIKKRVGYRVIRCEVGPKPGTKSRAITHIYDRVSFSIEGYVDDLITTLLSISEGMENPAVVMTEWGEYPEYAVVGWRELNDKEKAIIKTMKDKQKREKEQERNRKENELRKQFESLKKERPEWFDNDD